VHLNMEVYFSIFAQANQLNNKMHTTQLPSQMHTNPCIGLKLSIDAPLNTVDGQI